MRIFGKDRKLGVAENKGRYDLPLNTGASAKFMVLLVALMTFLALMAIVGSFALDDMADRWTSGLSNRLSVEIPAMSPQGSIRSGEKIKALAREVSDALNTNPNIRAIETLSQKQVQELVSPWLGEMQSWDDIPLPGLISIEIFSAETAQIERIATTLKGIEKDIRIETHESWLHDILRLTHSLQLSAGLITLVIGLTTITAIAGAIRSRIAEHKHDVELLHLMGANDHYIAKQFQRHALLLALKGSTAGLVAGGLMLFLLTLGSSETGLLPSLSLGGVQVVTLLLLPLFAALIAWLTARQTVLRFLSLMP